VIATGRSDYPNQVNNVLCFPYIFRGALDCGATTITREMEIAAVHAIAELAQAEQSDVVATTYGVTNLSFGPDYLIPKPFDPRLMMKIAPAVARAAEQSGVCAASYQGHDSLHGSLAAIRVSQRQLHEAGFYYRQKSTGCEKTYRFR
jgi:malate dehydrogenase (oxaloacetate-decarboxylating)(NADP+)